MKIYITEENIEHGKPSNEGSCALALAFKDAGFSGVIVGDETVDLWDEADDIRIKSYKLPKSLMEFVEAFDDVGQLVEPLTFDLSDLARC